MKLKIFSLSLLLAASSMQAQQTANCKVDGNDITITYYQDNIVRITKVPAGHKFQQPSLSVIAQPQDGLKVRQSQKGNTLTMQSSKLRTAIDMQTGLVAFYSADSLLIEEQATQKAFVPINDCGDKTYAVAQSFRLPTQEAIFGLGQIQDERMSLRNYKKRLAQGNLEDFSPVIQSVRGYGIFWDNYSTTDFADDDQGMSFRSEIGDAIDYYFIFGGNSDGVIAGLRTLTGQVPMFPLWTYGFFQSKERYKSQNEVVDVVRKYRELGVPLDGIIQDWQYWGDNYLWNAMEFNSENYSNPKRMMDQVHGLGAHLMISIWSSFGPMTKPYRELDSKGLLWNMSTWPQSGLSFWPPRMDYPSGVRVYNPYSSEARDIYWKYLSQGLFSQGIDGWWMDSTEPDHFDHKESDFDQQTGMGTWRRVRNAFPLMTVGGVYDHQRAESNAKRVFILTRSGFLGQQRYGSNVWSGDVTSSWKSLRAQVTAGLNWSMTGMPHWNSDIGGFFCGQYGHDLEAGKNPLYQELYVRWLQFGAFCPMMRSHGADAAREIYRFGKPGEAVFDAIADGIRLRYALMPYVYGLSWQVTHNQSTFMRPLAMDFPQDTNGWDLRDEYMFGPSLLVAPVVRPQYTTEKGTQVDAMEGWNRQEVTATGVQGLVDFTQPKEREVYLPGKLWYNYYTNEQVKGGQKVIFRGSLSQVPLYVRAGSILPMGPDVQYVGQKDWSELTIRVYPGANASFTLYEDEGDNYNYEQGKYTEIPLVWNDRNRTLTIGKRVGSYEGMIAARIFTIVLPSGKSKTISYNGKPVSVKF